jgi:hypothetical protein
LHIRLKHYSTLFTLDSLLIARVYFLARTPRTTDGLGVAGPTPRGFLVPAHPGTPPLDGDTGTLPLGRQSMSTPAPNLHYNRSYIPSVGTEGLQGLKVGLDRVPGEGQGEL